MLDFEFFFRLSSLRQTQMTPLHMASDGGLDDAVAELLANNADPEAVDEVS